MKVREMMNNNPALVTIGAVVLLVICLGFIFMQLNPNSGRRGPVDYYYYDLNANKLFVHPVKDYKDQPPIASPTDGENPKKPSGVWAHIYACGQCPGNLDGMSADQVKSETGAWISYLERMTLQAKRQLAKAQQSETPDDAYMAYEEGRMVKAYGQNGGWFQAMSPQAQSVYQINPDRCSGDESPKECFPNR